MRDEIMAPRPAVRRSGGPAVRLLGWLSTGILLIIAGCDGEAPARPATAAPPPAVAAPDPVAAAPAADVVWRWTPPADGKPLVAAGDGWNTFITGPPGVLKGGHDYLAELAYRVVTPPPYPGNPFPGTFHMYARSKSLGQGRDVWLNWLGDAGARGTARLPMVLVPADDWIFYVGCKGKAELVVEKLEIRAGTGFAYEPATAGATAPAAPATPVATGCPAVTIAPPAPQGDLEVSTAEFGLSATAATPEAEAANALALQRALRACGERKAARLLIPAGSYRIGGKEPIGVSGLRDLTIAADGAELVFTRLIRNVSALHFTGCERLAVRGLAIDWDWVANPIASVAVVREVAADRCSAVLAFPDLDPAGVQRLKTAEWSSLTPFDPATMRIGEGPGLNPKLAAREDAGPDALRATFTSAQPIVAGRTYMIRHLYYEMGAFKLADSHDILFQGVNVYSMPGMGWVARGDLHHLGLVGCAIKRKPGTRRPLSTAADGFHVLDSQGSILIQDCEITGTGDDCINIHDNCAQGVRQTGPSALTLAGNSKWKMKVAVGDKLDFFRPDCEPLGWTGTVQAVTFPGNDTAVEFAEALPMALSQLSIVRNQRYRTVDVRIAGCRFGFGRVLVSAQRASIEGCEFDHPFANAVQLHTEIVGSLWAEGSGAEDVVIRGNTITAANRRGKFGGAAIHGAPVIPAGRTEYPIFRRILIEDNRFSDSYGPIVELGACRDVVVRNNRVEADADLPGTAAQAGAILVECSQELRLGGNVWKNGPGQRKPGVVWDKATVKEMEAKGNRLE